MIFDRLVFGSARLTGGATAANAERLVYACKAEGIRQFDTAPSYGLGTAEQVIGRAVGKDEACRISTKVGSEQPSYPQLRSWMRLAKGLIRPGTSPLAVPLSPAVIREPCHSAFASEQMARSVANSRRQLRRSNLDLLLLHDITPEQVNNDIINFMLDARAKGWASEVGHATGGLENPRLSALFPSDFIIQAAAAPSHLLGMTAPGQASILHSIARTAEYLASHDSAFADRLGTIAGSVPQDKADATSARVAAAYTLVHAHNPDCRLIFATTHLDRLGGFLAAARFLTQTTGT